MKKIFIFALLFTMNLNLIIPQNNYFTIINNDEKGMANLIDPDGNPFYSIGINRMTIRTTKEMHTGKHPYEELWISQHGKYHSKSRKYPDKAIEDKSYSIWAREVMSRMKNWNFNTIGGFSNEGLTAYMPYIKNLDCFNNGKIKDFWSEDFQNLLNQLKSEINLHKNRKNLIGITLGNEYMWGPIDTNSKAEDLIYKYLMLNHSPGKNELIDFIERFYRDDNNVPKYAGKLSPINRCKKAMAFLFPSDQIKAFKDMKSFDYSQFKSKIPPIQIYIKNATLVDKMLLGKLLNQFIIQNNDTYSSIPENTMLKKDGFHQVELREEWTKQVAKKFYSECVSTIREIDQNHLIFSDRYFAPCTPQSVVEVAAEFVDALCVNHYDWTKAYDPGSTTYSFEESPNNELYEDIYSQIGLNANPNLWQKLSAWIFRRYIRKKTNLGEMDSVFYQNLSKADLHHLTIKCIDYIYDYFHICSFADDLQTYYQIAKKPILVTEFSVRAKEVRPQINLPGDQVYDPAKMNQLPDFISLVKNQKQRGIWYNQQVQIFLDKPYIIGYHWFCYFDQSYYGAKLDNANIGENSNFGLLDINNVPYDDFISSVIKKNDEAIKKRAQGNNYQSAINQEYY
ncbi:MAG: hypothetical protein MJB14_01245 [Spirochaetes bacterium]|nr:hypothetical protein [Spirochaetota bacterium]